MPEESVLDLSTQDTATDSEIHGDVGSDAASIQQNIDRDIQDDTSDILGQVDEVDAQDGSASSDADRKSDKSRQDAQRTAITKYLRELRGNAELKDVAEALNKAYFRDSEYQNLFPNMEELRNLKSTLDVMGGVDAITQLRDLEIGVEAMDRMVEQGNPQVIQDMAMESPDGFKKLVPAALNELEKMDVRAYAETLRPHLARGIEQSGLGNTVGNTLQLIAKAYNAADPEHAKFYIEQAHAEMIQIGQWLESLATQSRENKDAPSRETQSQSAIQQSPSIDMENVRQEASAWAHKEVQSTLKPFLNGRNMSESAVNDLISGIAMEIDSRLAQDADFQRNLAAWAQSGKTDRVLAWVKHGIQRIQTDATRAVWERRYGAVKTPVKTTTAVPAAKTQANNTQKTAKKDTVAVQLPKRPPMAQLDMTKDPDRLLYITHRAYMKDGRMVQWK